MMELYGGGYSRWVKSYWMLKELGQDFQEYPVDFSKGENRTPKILAMNPFGKLPILKDGANVIFESSAILNYLGAKFPESNLVPKDGTSERAIYDQWLFFSVTDLEQPLWRITKHARLLPENLRLPQDIELASIEFKGIMKALDAAIGDKFYLVGDRFTAADISVAYTLRWAGAFKLLSGFANCERYCRDLTARPAFPKHLFPY